MAFQWAQSDRKFVWHLGELGLPRATNEVHGPGVFFYSDQPITDSHVHQFHQCAPLLPTQLLLLWPGLFTFLTLLDKDKIKLWVPSVHSLLV